MKPPLFSLGLVALLAFSPLVRSQASEVSERFLSLSRELRTHRSEMLQRFSGEEGLRPITRGRGVRIYLRWAPPSGERLRNLTLTLESDGQETQQSLPVREERLWDLVWYSALLPRPSGDVGVLRVKADVEAQRYRSPFQSVKDVQVFEGSLPIVMATASGVLGIVVELDAEKSLKLSRLVTIEGARAR